MTSICVATFPNLYVMRWLSPFLEHVFPRSRLNTRTYSKVLSSSTSGSGLPYPIPPCTSLYPVPARPTWPFQSPHGSEIQILRSWQSQYQLIKEQVLNPITRPLCWAFTYRMVTTWWSTISFTKMILLETPHLKNFLNPLFGHKHSYTNSVLVISRPVELVPGVLALDCVAVNTTEYGLNSADIYFPTGYSVSTTH